MWCEAILEKLSGKKVLLNQINCCTVRFSCIEGKLIKPAGGLLSELICHIINVWYLMETVHIFGKTPKSYP